MAERSHAGVQHTAIVTAPIDVAALMHRIEDDGVGAISVFVGTVRELNEGRAVSGMDYEAYEPMAASELRAIAEEACAQRAGLRVAVEHRVGTLAIREASVVIVAAHAHRGPAMDAARYIIETLKQRVPIWKREHYRDGERVWIDPTRRVDAA